MSNLTKYIVEKSASHVKSELTSILAKEITKSYVKTTWDNFDLIIRIEKMGLSEIVIQLKEIENKCQIQEIKRKLAMMHKPFLSEVEKMVDDIFINKLGAKKA